MPPASHPIPGRAGNHVSIALALVLAAAGCADGGDPALGEAPANAPAPDATAGPIDVPPPVPPVPPTPPAPSVQVPGPFQGTFAADPTACTTPGDLTLLTIGAETITFYESTGPVVSVNLAGDDLTLGARLTGEGQTWDATYRFGLSDDGNTLTDLDGGTVRVRCVPKPAVDGDAGRA